jgi:hypothetical protein
MPRPPIEDDGQHRDDPGGPVMPEAQHHEDHDPGVRHAFITAALDAGVPLRDVQEAASHADPRTTMRQSGSAPRWTGTATYIVAGAAR